MICPNLKNKEVKIEFMKISNLIGSNNAYKVWNLNNGNPLHLNSDGSPSQTYKDLMNKLINDEELVIKKISENLLNNEIIIEPNELQKQSFIAFNEIATEQYTNKVKDLLLYNFSKIGLNNINVIADTTLKDNASVEKIDGVITIKFNPNKIKNDSIFHEFGHIYIDLIEDKVFIQNIIDKLKGTDLWYKIALLYPELTEEQLGKEVLTTAIGMKAKEIYNTSEDVSWWKFIVNLIKSKLQELFNTKEHQIEQLANDLITGDFSKQINHNYDILLQHQKDAIDINSLKDWTEAIQSQSNKLQSLIKQYKDLGIRPEEVNDSIKVKAKYDRYLNHLNNTNLTNMFEACVSMLEFDKTTLITVEQDIEKLKKVFNKNFTPETITLDEFNYLNQRINFARNFVNSIIDISNITNPLLATDLDFINGELSQEEVTYINNINNSYLKLMQSVDIKSFDRRVKEINMVLDKFRQISMTWVLQLSSNPRYEKFEQSDWMDLYKTGLVDETTMQLYFDSIFDSSNSFLANFAKYEMFNYSFMNDEIRRLKIEFNKQLKTAGGNDVYDKIIENGRLIQKYKFSEFWTDLNKALTEGNKNDAWNIKLKYANIATPDEFNKAIVNMRSKVKDDLDLKQMSVEEASNYITEEEWNLWIKDNFHQKSDGTYIPRIGGLYALPKDTYINPKWETLQSNPITKEFHGYMVELMRKLTSHASNSPQYKGYMAAISKTKLNKVKVEKLDEEFSDMDGNKLYTIPFPFLGYLSNETKIPIRQQVTDETDEMYEKSIVDYANLLFKDKVGFVPFTTLKEILKENDNIEKRNKEFHKEHVNTDLKYTMDLFIESAITNKYKARMYDSVMLALYSFENDTLINTNNKGKNVIDKLKYAIGLTDSGEINRQPNTYLTKGVLTKSAKHLRKKIEMTFFDMFTKPNDYNDVLQKFKNYTSLIGIGFNGLAAFKNVTYGGYMSLIESSCKQFISFKSLDKGARLYHSGLVDYFSTMNSETSNTLVGALIKRLNIIENYTDLLEKQSPSLHENKLHKLFISTAYAGTTMGEHMMHNTVLMAMLNEYKLIDGKLTNYKDYSRKLIKKTETDNIDEIDKKNKDLLDTFNNTPSLINMFELIDGVAEIKKDENGKPLISDIQYAQFKSLVKGVNQHLHGIYNKEDKGIIENNVLGQLLMQFRHWMRPGWNKRFNSRGVPYIFQIWNSKEFGENQNYWNERRNVESYGDYNSLTKALTSGIKEQYIEHLNNKIVDNKLGNKSLAILSSISLGMYKQIVNARMYWNTMNDEEKSGAIRAIAELGMVALLITVYSLAFDDDDDDKYFGKDFLIYQLDASITELLSYVPLYGWVNEGLKVTANPTGTWSTMLKLFKLTKELVEYPFVKEDELYYKRGVHKGELQLKWMFINVVPIGGQINRWMKLDDQNKAYKQWGMPQ